MSPLTKDYGTLVDEIASLHAKYSPAAAVVSPPHALPGQWIPAAVDTTTAHLGERPVLVAFGANYATGMGNLPCKATAVHRGRAPYVEANLNRQRCRALKFLRACASGKVKSHWKGLLPYDPDEQYRKTALGRLGPTPHFVMCNLCPWITSSDWGKIRDKSLEDLFELVAAPRFSQGRNWEYFKELRKTLGSKAIWIGHGNAEVYGLFQLLCRRLDIEEWFFDSNLSQRSLMVI